VRSPCPRAECDLDKFNLDLIYMQPVGTTAGSKWDQLLLNRKKGGPAAFKQEKGGPAAFNLPAVHCSELQQDLDPNPGRPSGSQVDLRLLVGQTFSQGTPSLEPCVANCQKHDNTIHLGH